MTQHLKPQQNMFMKNIEIEITISIDASRIHEISRQNKSTMKPKTSSIVDDIINVKSKIQILNAYSASPEANHKK